jgi:hypothetical protein
MNKENCIDILLYLTEIKAANAIDKKYKKGIDKHISFLKEIINDSEDINEKHSEYKIRFLALLKWIFEFLIS